MSKIKVAEISTHKIIPNGVPVTKDHIDNLKKKPRGRPKAKDAVPE